MGFKVVVWGAAESGKRQLIDRMLYDTFSKKTGRNLVIEFTEQKVVTESKVETLIFWNVSCKPFENSFKTYLKDSKLVLITCDLTQEVTTAKTSIELYLKTAEINKEDIFLIGTKYDHPDADETKKKSFQEYADALGLKTYCVSAKSGFGIANLFAKIKEKALTAPEIMLQQQEEQVIATEPEFNYVTALLTCCGLFSWCGPEHADDGKSKLLQKTR